MDVARAVGRARRLQGQPGALGREPAALVPRQDGPADLVAICPQELTVAPAVGALLPPVPVPAGPVSVQDDRPWGVGECAADRAWPRSACGSCKVA